MNRPIISFESVSKSYGDVQVLKRVNFTIEKGEIFAFLGPNGAGKSTTISLLLDHQKPDSGTITLFGKNVGLEALSIRRQTGLLPDGCAYYRDMSGREHLEFARSVRRSETDINVLLERVGIGDAADAAVGTYSSGMRKRLGIAFALVGKPDLLLLDEPTAGLDPNGVIRLQEILEAERRRGATIIFSSHNLEQVREVCDRVGYINNGDVEVAELGRESATNGVVHLTIQCNDLDEADVASMPTVIDASPVDGGLQVTCHPDDKMAVIRRIDDAAEVIDFTSYNRTLEALFESVSETKSSKIESETGVIE